MDDPNAYYFPELNIPFLKEFAARWILPKLPLNNITLYRYFNSEPDENYPIFAVVYEVDEEQSEMIEEFDKANDPRIGFSYVYGAVFESVGKGKDKNKDINVLKKILKIDQSFKNVYKDKPNDNYEKEWDLFFWSKNEPMLKGVMVDEPHITLWEYNKAQVDKSKKQTSKTEIPEEVLELLNNAKQEIDMIYEAVKKKGLSSEEKKLQEAALKAFDAMPYFFKYLKREMLANKNLFSLNPGQELRDYESSLMHAIVKSEMQLSIGGQRLRSAYKKASKQKPTSKTD